MNDETPTPIRNFSVRLSPTPRGARLARLLATEQLRAWELPLDPARHIVAELAANAVTHGRVPGRDFRLTLYVVADTLRIEVTDTRGDRMPCAELPGGEAESGRGLVLVDALADKWGVTPGLPPRKTVWAEIRVALSTRERVPVGPLSGDTVCLFSRNNPVKGPRPNQTPAPHPHG